MKIVILTSKNHPYSNFVLKNLLCSDVFENDKLFVFEQDWVIPYRSSIFSVIKYWLSAGFYYTFAQIIKYFLFLFARTTSRLKSEKSSPYYPYYKIRHHWLKRRRLNDLKSQQAYAKIREIEPDLILSIYSKEILPENIISLPKNGCVNLHPAFLPNYRGVSPTFWTMANNEKKTGITLHYIDKGIDTGKIISQQEILTDQFKTEHSLYMYSSKLGIDLIKEYLNKIRNAQEIITKENPVEGSYFKLPTKKAVKKFRQNGYSFYKLNEFKKKLNYGQEKNPAEINVKTYRLKAVKEIGIYKSIKYIIQVPMLALFNILGYSPLRVIFLRILGAKIGKNCIIHRVRFFNWYRSSFSSLTLGDDCFIGDDCLLDLANKITLEDNVTIAERVNILTHINVGYSDHPLQKYFPRSDSAVVLEEGSFIGINSTILQGVVIGPKSFVGACSLVNKNIPAETIAYGVPAKAVKNIKAD